MMNNECTALLDTLGIEYTCYTHRAVFTSAEAKDVDEHIPGVRVKNLFLRNKRGDQHYLLVLPGEVRVDLKLLAKDIGSDKLSFASPERLMTYLGVTPGSVSPLALMHDQQAHVQVYLDASIWDDPTGYQIHPNINTATVVLHRSQLETFTAHTGHTLQPVTISTTLITE